MKKSKITLLIMGILCTLLVFVISFLIIVNVKHDNPTPINTLPSSHNGELNDNEQELQYLEKVLNNRDEQKWKDELAEVKEIDNLKTESVNDGYITLEQLESYLHVKHTEDAREHPQIKLDDRTVTFNLNTNFIEYDSETFSEKLKQEDGEIYIPNSFIKQYYDINVIKTKTGNKLTSFETIPVLLYHTVNDGANSTLNTQPEKFEQQIKSLIFNGYTGISPFELYDFYYGEGTLPEKPIFINFDDGAKDVYTGAYPVLQKYGMKATLFIIASKVEHEGINSFPNEIRKISWEDAHDMSDLVTIQSHTWNLHRKIKSKNGIEIGQIAAPQLKDNKEYETLEEYISKITTDIKKAQDIILEKMGYPSIIISFPYGEYSKEAISVITQLGASFAVSVNQGQSLNVDNLMVINRLVVNGNWSGEELLEKIESENLK